MYGIKNYIPHDEDEIIPVVVLPLADWERLVAHYEALKAQPFIEYRDDGVCLDSHAWAVAEIDAIIKKVKP